MAADTDNPGLPRKILLATDLSARGDRALERAIDVARRHDAELVIVHAFEEVDESTLTYGKRPAPSWRQPPDAVALMKQRIAHGLREDLGETIDRASLFIEEGDPAAVIERVATAERVDLIVTGIAREGLFASRPVILGRTVEQLLRRLPVPMLIVRNRALSAYRHVVVATDFSETSGCALQVALRFFPSQSLHLVHASEAPYATLASDTARHAEDFKEQHSAELEEFLGSVFMSAADRQRIVPRVEPGAPQAIIREYVKVHGADLVVMGTRGRGAVMETLLGSTAKSILSTLPCDALVVRGPRQ